MAAITVTDLTSGDLTGNGVFDELMRGTKAHIQDEYEKGRIKGSEYATVYLGALEAVMNQSLQFLLQQQRVDAEARLMEAQIQTEALNQDRIAQQTSNLQAEALNIPKQGALLDAQVAVQGQQKLNLQSEKLQTEAQTALIDQQTANAITENTVLVAQECKLRADYDLVMEQKLKAIAETSLLNQKKVTEQAQTSGTGVDVDSVIGKQKALYQGQIDGYKRDAEQKVAKLMADTWNVRRTTDEATVADEINKLSDGNVGRAIDKLLAGVNA